MERFPGGKEWPHLYSKRQVLVLFLHILSIILQNRQLYFGSLKRNQQICNPKNKDVMARVCQVTGKKPITGNKVSHSNIKTKRKFNPNLQTKRFFLAEEDKWVTLKVSSEAIRTINKNGLFVVVKELRAQGVHI